MNGDLNDWVLIKPYGKPRVADVKNYYVGLTFYLFQVLPNPLREFFFTDIIRRNPYDRLILVFR